jgi:hypothetical protein
MEIWGVVIKYTCLQDYDSLDASHKLSFLEDACIRLESYRASMQTKRACSLVCSQWRAYAIEYLFESLWISSASQAKCLSYTLIMQSLREDQRTYGSYIRQIHIQTPVHSAVPRPTFSQSSSLLRTCPSTATITPFGAVSMMMARTLGAARKQFSSSSQTQDPSAELDQLWQRNVPAAHDSAAHQPGRAARVP